jgi:hypothetical protein
MEERASAPVALRTSYRVLAALVLFGGIPIFILGSGFAGGFGGALNSFRMGLAEFSLFSIMFLLPLLFLPLYWWLGRRVASRTGLGWRIIIALACAFGAFLLVAQIEDTPVEEWPSACHRGVYRLDDGRTMAVTASSVASLMVYLSDGTRVMTWGGENSFSGTSCIGGRNGVRDDFSMEAPSCPADVLRVKTHDAPVQNARRLRVQTVVADFESGGVDFKARLFIPAADEPVPLIVIPARRDGGSRLDWGHTHYLASGLGVAVFVYDKPGEWPDGESEIGRDEALTHAVAAMAKARATGAGRVSRAGFFGDEDALLAIRRTKADFAVVDAEALPAKLLQNAGVPVLWLLPSKADGRAEVAAQSELRKLPRASPVKLVVMRGADEHLAFYQQRGDERCSVSSPAGYWPTIVDWLGGLKRSMPR